MILCENDYTAPIFQTGDLDRSYYNIIPYYDLRPVDGTRADIVYAVKFKTVPMRLNVYSYSHMYTVTSYNIILVLS